MQGYLYGFETMQYGLQMHQNRLRYYSYYRLVLPYETLLDHLRTNLALPLDPIKPYTAPM